MIQLRTESDLIGNMEIPAYALYGIHALRAKKNFPDQTAFPAEWYEAVGMVKQACYETYRDYRNAVSEKYLGKELPFTVIPDEILDALALSAEEVAEGKHFGDFIVPAISGGAGTSINMNINEIIANLALKKLGKDPGQYEFVDPIEHANVFQSTNDVIPTALKVAVMILLNKLEETINILRSKVEGMENAHRNELRIGYTQMQEAVPSSYGKLFSTYSESFSRDWWRVSKCFERIKLVNLGGSAIGTGLAVPRFFIMEATGHLQKLTGLPVARSENMADATSSLDPFVEIHATLKAHAVNLEKMVSDLRLLASDIASGKEVMIPQKQAGSSIMPGKVNPVIPEYVISAVHRVYANDQLITSLCAQGCLELNAYLPAIGCALIESINLLVSAGKTTASNLLEGLTINAKTGEEKLFRSPVITTALVPFIGYNKASELAKRMKSDGIDIFAANKILQLVSEEKLGTILKPENLLKLGYTMDDLQED
ncbi:MAG: lyase family protein [Bacteroidetes bacterium]|nr:lyase family protein [Bacteroidota bacterium]